MILWMDRILHHPRHHEKPLFVGIYRESSKARVSEVVPKRISQPSTVWLHLLCIPFWGRFKGQLQDEPLAPFGDARRWVGQDTPFLSTSQVQDEARVALAQSGLGRL